jgi:hypothetical protein
LHGIAQAWADGEEFPVRGRDFVGMEIETRRSPDLAAALEIAEVVQPPPVGPGLEAGEQFHERFFTRTDDRGVRQLPELGTPLRRKAAKNEQCTRAPLSDLLHEAPNRSCIHKQRR